MTTDEMWLLEYYKIAIEDQERSKKRIYETPYYTAVLFGGLFAVVAVFNDAGITSPTFYAAVLIATVVIAALSTLQTYNSWRWLEWFRRITAMYDSEKFPEVIRQIRVSVGRIKKEPRGPGAVTYKTHNKSLGDLPLKILTLSSPIGGAVFLIWFVASTGKLLE